MERAQMLAYYDAIGMVTIVVVSILGVKFLGPMGLVVSMVVALALRELRRHRTPGG